MEKTPCPNCGNPNLAPDDRFCWNCGFEFGNCCENPDCQDSDDLTLPDEFTYCPYCGEETRFAKLGFAERIEFEGQP